MEKDYCVVVRYRTSSICSPDRNETAAHSLSAKGVADDMTQLMQGPKNSKELPGTTEDSYFLDHISENDSYDSEEGTTGSQPDVSPILNIGQLPDSFEQSTELIVSLNSQS